MYRRVLAAVCVVLCLPALALEKQPAAEYRARRVALAAKLHGGAMLLFGADAPREEYLSFRQDDDYYYLTGWNEPGAVLLIEAAYTPVPSTSPIASPVPLAAQPYKEILFLPERNLRTELFTGVKLDAATPDAAAMAGVDEVRQIKDLPAELVRMSSGTTRAAHVVISVDDAKAKAALQLFGASLGREIPAAPTDLRVLTTPLRMVKSPGEIALLKKAADASVAAHLAEMKAVKPGASERTISGLIDYKLKENGCERPSYPSIVGSGIHSTELHYDADDDTMRDGDVEVTDAAGEYSMYASDVTRTLPVNGHFTPRQREVYDIVLGAQRAAMASFVSGKTTMRDLDTTARNYIATHGKDLHGESLSKYFIHSVGHSVGINVHDPFDPTMAWGPGAVFTIEPGIYIPEEKIGVRIEDTFYVDANGKLVDFIAALPHTADEVEAAMRPEPVKRRH